MCRVRRACCVWCVSCLFCAEYSLRTLHALPVRPVLHALPVLLMMPALSPLCDGGCTQRALCCMRCLCVLCCLCAEPAVRWRAGATFHNATVGVGPTLRLLRPPIELVPGVGTGTTSSPFPLLSSLLSSVSSHLLFSPLSYPSAPLPSALIQSNTILSDLVSSPRTSRSVSAHAPRPLPKADVSASAKL